jgi:hypothetical protein
MITGFEIYNLSKNKIEMYGLTKNTIVLFNNSNLKYKFVKEFLKIELDETKDEDDSIIYSTIVNSEEDDHRADIRQIIAYQPTSIFMVDNEQRFIFTVEAPFIFQCTDPYDLWFCNINANGKIQVYAFTEFKNYKEVWGMGVEAVYKAFTNGRYGCYEGYGR